MAERETESTRMGAWHVPGSPTLTAWPLCGRVPSPSVRTRRYTLQLLTDRAPGHSVEVRIPPFAAVQAIPGPVHRRGTPSAVVEMDPVTWLALSTGGLSWAQARAAGRIRASGERADLATWLPLISL
jgi:Bacterial SCP ortholog